MIKMLILFLISFIFSFSIQIIATLKSIPKVQILKNSEESESQL